MENDVEPCDCDSKDFEFSDEQASKKTTEYKKKVPLALCLSSNASNCFALIVDCDWMQAFRITMWSSRCLHIFAIHVISHWLRMNCIQVLCSPSIGRRRYDCVFHTAYSFLSMTGRIKVSVEGKQQKNKRTNEHITHTHMKPNEANTFFKFFPLKLVAHISMQIMRSQNNSIQSFDTLYFFLLLPGFPRHEYNHFHYHCDRIMNWKQEQNPFNKKKEKEKKK